MAVCTKNNPIFDILNNRARGKEYGIYSCCSSNEFVLRAAMRRAMAADTVVLIESTANQVNQDGGYTGMTPVDFYNFVQQLAAEERFPPEKLFLGGDHLGPLTFRDLPEAEAMPKAVELVQAYAAAGFSKLHLDTSMRLADDNPTETLTDATIARRGAVLCKAAEEAFASYQLTHPEACKPVYIIGSEVPIPGGAQENEDSVSVTSPDACEATLGAFRAAFSAAGLDDVWPRVIGLVVQPGVEFADESVIAYDRAAAKNLTACLKKYPGLVFEGHSTDYQPKQCLREMVGDGIAILKVGPALTFALREGLFALEQIEREQNQMQDFPLSHFRETLEHVMLEDKRKWEHYYHGDMPRKRYARAFSFSDRARYYLTEPSVQNAIHALLRNLDKNGIPLALLSQYLPMQYERVVDQALPLKADALLIDHVGDRIDDYLYAVMK